MGTAIRDARQAAGLSQVELARRLGVKQQSVAKWEGGQTRPATERLLDVAQVLNTSLDSLLSGSFAPGTSVSPGTDVDVVIDLHPETDDEDDPPPTSPAGAQVMAMDTSVLMGIAAVDGQPISADERARIEDFVRGLRSQSGSGQ